MVLLAFTTLPLSANFELSQFWRHSSDDITLCGFVDNVSFPDSGVLCILGQTAILKGLLAV